MIGYPFNSHVEYDEHDLPVFDRAISSEPLKNLISKLFSNGVLPNPSTNLQVVSGGAGMTVIVKAGFCIINGGLKLEDEDKTLVVQASDATYPRIDTVVMRWNDNDDVRACDLYIVEGTPSASPVRPELTRTGSIYEIGLADIYITARSTSVDSFRITDTRIDTARCGYISSISEFDTSTLYAQIQSDLNNFQENEQADFLAWFEEMRDQLSEDAAGNLQLQMDTLNGRYNGLTQDISEFVVLNQLPSQGREKTLYLITGEEETHYAGDVQDDTSIINDNVIAKGTTFSSDRIDTLLGYKVNAEQGKGLSTNDFTNADKTKVDSAITAIKTINGQDIRGTGNINFPVGTQVEPNPVLSGNEPTLDGIEINGVKFRSGGSGSDVFDKALVNAKRSLVSNKGTMLFAFDASKEGLSGQTSTASVKNDYSIFKNNSHSCLIYSEDTTKRVVDTFFSFPEETFGENTYGFWLYIPTVADLNALNYIQIDAGSVNQHGQLSGSQKIWQYYATSLNVGWNYCPFNQTHTLTVFSGLRIRFVDVNGSTATEFHEKHVYFDSIVKNYAMKPCVLLAFDNSSDANMYGVAYAEAKARGIVGTFAYQGGDNPDGERGYRVGVTREHLNEMLAEGWDVAQYDGFNMEQDIDDIKAYNEFLKGQGLEMTAYFPRFNAITEDIWSNLAEMGFKLARTANSLNVVSADNLDVIQSYGFTFTNNASVTLGKINDAISANQSMCILIHRVLAESDGTQNNCLLSEYQTFLDGLKALRDNGTIYIVTFKEYYYDSLMKSVVDKFA